MTPGPVFLAELVRRRSGLIVGPDKGYLLQTRLAGLLRREGLADLHALAALLAGGGHPALEREVTEAMATHETLFFRDGKPFEHLRAAGLPGLARVRPPGSRLRLWSAAAATGQEAYSLAMTAMESGVLERNRVEILGTDLAQSALARARQGRYSQYEVQRGLSAHRLLRYFSRDGDEWRVDPAVRRLCQFRDWNLLDDPAPLGEFDVVFCRNVLIYLDAATKLRVLDQVRRRLAPGGLLYLGAAETAMGMERDGPCYAAA